MKQLSRVLKIILKYNNIQIIIQIIFQIRLIGVDKKVYILKIQVGNAMNRSLVSF